MNDSRFPVFRKHKERVSSSSLLPLMEERRVLKPPLSSRSASGQGSKVKSSRLPKPSITASRPTISRPISQTRPQISTNRPASSTTSSAHPSVRQSLNPSSSLPYINPLHRTSVASESLGSKQRRNLSVSNIQAHASSDTSLPPPGSDHCVDPRPQSLPPIPREKNTDHNRMTERLPPRVSHPTNPSLDPFKVHANRILRPSTTMTAVGTVTPAPHSMSTTPSSSSSSRSSLSARRRSSRPSSDSVTYTAQTASLPPPPRSSSLLSSSSSTDATSTRFGQLQPALEPRNRRSQYRPTSRSQSRHQSPILNSQSPCSLRRTATVRSTHSTMSFPASSSNPHSKATGASTGNPTGRRGVGFSGGGIASQHHKRRKPSISGAESFMMMVRTSSSGSRAGSSRLGRRVHQGNGYGREFGTEELFDEEEEEGYEGLGHEVAARDELGDQEKTKELVGHWQAFVGIDSSSMRTGGDTSILDQSPLLLDETSDSPPEQDSPSFCAATTTSSISHATRTRSRSRSQSRPRSRAKVLSISSAPRELSQTLPQLNRYLHTRTPSHPPTRNLYSESRSAAAGDEVLGGSEMTRVDSEVLLTRLTLKRLGSTGFEGDALDKLGRGEGPEEEDLRNIVVSEEGEGGGRGMEDDDGLDWADQYRDSYDGWNSEVVVAELCAKEEENVRPMSPPSPSSSASSFSSPRRRKAWKWGHDGSLPSSESSSTMSSSTSIGTLSRNWSKSTLMEELEKEVGRLSRDFKAYSPPSTTRPYDAHESIASGPEEDGYVCALDLIFEDSAESSASSSDEEDGAKEIPVRRGGGPLLGAPLGSLLSTNTSSTSNSGLSRLPRLKPSSSNLRPTIKTPTLSAASPPPSLPPVPSLPRGFVSKLAQPRSVSNKYITHVGGGVGAGGSASLRTKAKAGWV